MPHYDKPDESLDILISKLMEDHFPELVKANVTIETLFAYDDKGGHPVKCGGYPAMAVVKINNLKNRIKGLADVELTIDGEIFKNLTERQREGLCYHELLHLEVQYDKEGNLKVDDAGRAKIRLAKHDYQFGWFSKSAVQYGNDSPEVYQASLLWNRDGKAFFPTVA